MTHLSMYLPLPFTGEMLAEQLMHVHRFPLPRCNFGSMDGAGSVHFWSWLNPDVPVLPYGVHRSTATYNCKSVCWLVPSFHWLTALSPLDVTIIPAIVITSAAVIELQTAQETLETRFEHSLSLYLFLWTGWGLQEEQSTYWKASQPTLSAALTINREETKTMLEQCILYQQTRTYAQQNI